MASDQPCGAVLYAAISIWDLPARMHSQNTRKETEDGHRFMHLALPATGNVSKQMPASPMQQSNADLNTLS